MTDATTDLRRQISELSDRLAKVEQRLGLPPVIRTVPQPASDLVAPPSSSTPPPAPAAPAGLHGLISRARESRWGSPEPDCSSYGNEGPVAPASTGPFELSSPVPVLPTAPPTTRPSPAAPGPVVPRAAARLHPAQVAAPSGIAGIEKLIGGRWYAVIGAIIVVIGVGLFFRLAFQQGWLVLTPAAQCIAGAVFGALLMVGGEIARRRINDNAGAGLSAAGVGVAFASIYAAYGYHRGLLDQVPAFFLLASVATLGVIIGARARQVSVAIVSLLCGYLTPILLHEGDAPPLIFPTYLSTLLVVGLVLSAWRGGRFVAVRSLVWWATIALGSYWTLRFGDKEPLGALAFLALSWTAIHTELAISSGRFGLVPGTGGNIADDDDNAAGTLAKARRTAGSWRPLSSSFSTTTWATLLATIILRHWAATPDWLATAGFAVGSGMVAIMLAGHLRVLRDRPQTDSQRLGACLMVQAGALIIAATALAVQGPAQAILWLAMGVAVVIGGRWIGSRGLDIYGLIVLSLATGRTLLWESWNGTLPRTGVPFSGLYLNYWGALMATVGAGWLVVGFLFRRAGAGRAASPVVGNTAVAIGMTLLCVALQHDKASPLAPIFTVASLGLALTLIGHLLRSQGLKSYSLVVLGAITAYAFARRWWLGSVSGAGAEILGLHLTVWSLAVAYLGAVWLVAARFILLTVTPVSRTAAVICAGMGVALTMGALVHESTAGVSLIIAWMAIALGFGAAHLISPRLGLDRWGIAGLGATVMAWIVYFPPLGDGWRSSTAPAGLHAGLWTGLAIAGCFAFHTRRLLAPAAPGDSVRPVLVGASYLVMTALVFAATSLEVGRSAALLAHDRTVQRAAVSVWWGIFAFGLITLGFVLQGRFRSAPELPRGIPICRQVGLALLGIAALKALIFDLGQVEGLGRVISIVGVGLLMLAVSVTYAKVSTRLAVLRPQEPVELLQ